MNKETERVSYEGVLASTGLDGEQIKVIESAAHLNPLVVILGLTLAVGIAGAIILRTWHLAPTPPDPHDPNFTQLFANYSALTQNINDQAAKQLSMLAPLISGILGVGVGSKFGVKK